MKPAAKVCPFCQGALVPQEDRGLCVGPGSGHRPPPLGRAAVVAAGAGGQTDAEAHFGDAPK